MGGCVAAKDVTTGSSTIVARMLPIVIVERYLSINGRRILLFVASSRIVHRDAHCMTSRRSESGVWGNTVRHRVERNIVKVRIRTVGYEVRRATVAAVTP